MDSNELASAIGIDHAKHRGIVASTATVAELADYDQWTVSGSLDQHRPLYRVTLDDGTETAFSLGDSQPFLGSPLTIAIKPDTTSVKIDYAASPSRDVAGTLSGYRAHEKMAAEAAKKGSS